MFNFHLTTNANSDSSKNVMCLLYDENYKSMEDINEACTISRRTMATCHQL